MRARTTERRIKPRRDLRGTGYQLDLFPAPRLPMTSKIPAWLELPAETRVALTNLMTKLILEHADKSSVESKTEVSHDL
jgi:hypothetical protein